MKSHSFLFYEALFYSDLYIRVHISVSVIYLMSVQKNGWVCLSKCGAQMAMPLWINKSLYLHTTVIWSQ